MKACPFCAEEIQDAAILCRFCNRELTEGAAPPVTAPVPTVVVVERTPSNGVAAVLSFFIPGLGQIYQGRLGAGLLWLVVTVIGYMLLIVPGILLHLTCIVMAGSASPKAAPTTRPAPPPRTAEQVAADRAGDRRFLQWLGVAAIGLLVLAGAMSLVDQYWPRTPESSPSRTPSAAPMKSGFTEPLPGGTEIERQVRLAASIRLATPCSDVTRTFHQGLDKPNAESVWNATCRGGASYTVRYARLSPETAPTIARCDRSLVPCFSAFAD